MVYFTLANIPPSFRSRYEAIQLLAVAKTVDIKKYGPKILLSDFISGINTLQNGIQVNFKGNDFCLHGSLVMVLGDTPAAQWIGGFKEGVCFAQHGCRTCNASTRTMKSNFIPRHFQERDHDEHQNRCFQLTQMSKSASQYWSKCWGINDGSCLLDISMFNLSVCLVHDPMLILSEGIVTKEICCMLYHFLEVRKYFTLSWLNETVIICLHLFRTERQARNNQKAGHTRRKIEVDFSFAVFCPVFWALESQKMTARGNFS